ncbi:hypothetical protein GWG54_19420 [Natronococcus sp. JC468]|uniref:hypothetical protein n=1 Tax=Natronococcus sp. JC468 TaxID=1961921 RepID=UPI00143878E9|nr:hypothetical protein [Natronococcus sp. JC468]NKE37925.1 hypothetical protein [Natronococcus sp. JC468]
MNFILRANAAAVRLVAAVTLYAAIVLLLDGHIAGPIVIGLSAVILYLMAGSAQAGGLRRFSAGMIYFILLVLGTGLVSS